MAKKKLICQQHPVFPGGHPSKYWRGSMLLNFGDRTRTGAFSMIWPLTRKVRADQRFHSFSHSKYFLETRDGAGSNPQSWWRWQQGIFPIDLCFHPRSMLTFLQNAVSKSWSPVALSGLEVFGLNQPGFQLIWHGSRVRQLDKWVHQLVSQVFCSYRINLSPFTKDFRGQEAKIEHSSIFLRLPFGSCYATKINNITLVRLRLVSFNPT